MTMMSGALYDAPREAGASDPIARKAAEEVADIKTEFAKLNGRFDTLEAKLDAKFSQVVWMVGVNLTVSILAIGGPFGVLLRMAGH